MKKNIIVPLTLLASLGSYVAYMEYNKDPEPGHVAAPIERVMEIAPIEVSVITPSTLTETIRISGSLQPARKTILRALAAGIVTEVMVDEGEWVSKGQVLARFRGRDIEANVLQHQTNFEAAKAQLDLAEEELARSQSLFEKKITSLASLQKAENDLTAAKANLASKDAQLKVALTGRDDAEIVSPYDGIIASRSIEPGESAGNQAELFTVVDTSSFEMNALISTRDINRVNIGNVAAIKPEGFSEAIVATVVRISPTAKDGTRAINVALSIKSDVSNLWGGMYANGQLVTREKSNVLAIAKSAIRGHEGEHYVLKIVDGKIAQQPITIGHYWPENNLVEVDQGLNVGDQVITLPLAGVEPGVSVKISEI